MAYCKKTYRCGDSNEYEITYAGNYGAKGEKRAPKKKATPEQIEKQNKWNKRKYIRRLIKINFDIDDYWTTLRYPAGTKKELKEVEKDLRCFIRKMKYRYSKKGQQLKYIYRIEIGAKGGIHTHIILNRIPSGETDRLISECWTEGHAHNILLYAKGEYKALADYMAKEPKTEEGYKQLSLFDETDQKKLTAFSSSRNLIRPLPEKKNYSHWTMRKMLRDGPKATPGYYIDKDSIVTGINPFTGMSYLHYTEIKLGSIWEQWNKSG